MKSVSKFVGALSIGALASLGCSSKEEKPAEAESSKSESKASCGATKPAEGGGDKGKAACGAGKK